MPRTWCPRLAVGRLCRLAIAVALLSLLSSGVGVAQQPAPQADPADFGLLVPDSGSVRQGEGRRVLVTIGEKPTVALVHVDVGDRRLVILPSGRLHSATISETKATQQPFVPLTKDQLADQLKSKLFRDFKTRTTGHYLYIYNSSRGFFTATSRILETMYPGVVAYFKRQKFNVAEPATPLVVIMFHSEEAFQKYHPMPPGVVAYYNAVSNHIVMFEQSKLLDIAPELAVKQSIATIAHEGIHQILHNIGVQRRLSRWPMWISEGLPEYFAPTSVGKRMRWKGVGTVNDMRMFELQQHLTAGETSMQELLERTITAQQLSSTGYASAWALTHYLAKMKKDAFHAYLAEVSKIQPFAEFELGADGATRADRNLFVKHFGSDFDKIGNSLLKYLTKLPYEDPIANQTHYVVMLDTSAQRSAGVTTSPAAVRKWQAETLSTVPPGVRARASFQIVPFPDRTSAETYARQWLGRK